MTTEKQLHLWPSSGDARRADEHELQHGSVHWATVEPPADKGRLLALAAIPTPWAEMTGTEKDAFCLKFAQAMTAQRAAYMDALAGDSGT
jgi:acyl-CoA reductase-like NAD-dependent aldehyde dehydrogenase